MGAERNIEFCNNPKFQSIIFNKYRPLQPIGSGTFGIVISVEERLCDSNNKLKGRLNKIASKNGNKNGESPNIKPKTFACKIIDVSLSEEASEKETRQKLADLLNEVDMMIETTGHPNLQDIVDYSLEDNRLFIVSSLCRGGDLDQALQFRGSFCEEDARSVMSGIFNGLCHMHSLGIAHRDIKLENVLLVNNMHDVSKIKIIDMGFAKKLDAEDNEGSYSTVCGTPLYIAPELVKPIVRARVFVEETSQARYGTKADMWSCGVILYMLLAGYPPFALDDMARVMELFDEIATASYNFDDPVWELVSDEAKDLVKELLTVNPAKRLSAKEALRHPWVKGPDVS